ncbi:putative ABC transporter ATP-binding protein YjkB [Sporosarcina sp. NCCP-2716]|uniref:ABC transporter ATP-binding protein n=1 Tax=Sporosarcina sp. NCCP-2716 TaxID=2943679 RepID=UPI00203A7A14|nr:phosphate ABC transporter ATP-binding protein [Sporosarcina sp. NCCP-2716]GKV68550.1 putative ABC transporter ATP-binding protein YjkB [Sporosarcina sp. NCCP-2716]
MNIEENQVVNSLRLEGVQYGVNGKQIITDATGSIPDGQITALIGPSGAGKTTLLKLCNGLISPTAGEIYIEGKLIGDLSPITLRRRVGIVLQSSPMVKGTVYDNLELPLRLQGKTLSDQQAAELVERVGLPAAVLTQDARELSGGQRQKVSIARTLVNNSKILLLDEITASLDPESLQEIEELIVGLNRAESVTVVWITHNLAQAARVGENFWVMADGVIRAAGTKEQIHASEDEEVQRFVKGVLS